jgi:hypothetical protein
VYTYAEVNRVMDAFKGGQQRMINAVIPKTNVDFLSYSAYDVQLQPLETVRAALDYANQQLPPKAGLPARRVFIGECGLSWEACGGDGKVHEQRNREILAKFLAWRPALVLYWQLYNNEVKDGKQVGFWLIDSPSRKRWLRRCCCVRAGSPPSRRWPPSPRTGSASGAADRTPDLRSRRRPRD